MTTTFADTLAERLRNDPARPLVTFYDHATEERVELSIATYANWVAKGGSLLADELDLAKGDTLRIDLPPHWLAPVFLGAAWSAGLVVVDDDRPDAVVCGPDTVAQWGAHAGELAVLACSLLPLGVRFSDPLPDGVHDVGVEIWSQPDAFTPWDPPLPDDPALRLSGDTVVHGDLAQVGQAAAGLDLGAGGRLLTTANPATEPAVFIAPFHHDGSMVLVAQADRDRLEATSADEQVTDRFPA